MKKILTGKKGFTLTELIIVIAIIGILAAVLVPSLSGYIKKSKESALEQEARSISAIYETWLLDEETYDKVYNNDPEDQEMTAEVVATKEFKTYYEELGNAWFGEGITFSIRLDSSTNKPSGFTLQKGNLVAIYTNGGNLVIEVPQS